MSSSSWQKWHMWSELLNRMFLSLKFNFVGNLSLDNLQMKAATVDGIGKFHNWSKKKESTWPGIGRSTLYTSCTPYNPVDAFFHDKVSSTCLLRTIPSNSGKQLLSGGISQSNHPLLHLNSLTQISFSQHPISPVEACFCTELKYNLLYFTWKEEPPVAIMYQNFNFFHHPPSIQHSYQTIDSLHQSHTHQLNLFTKWNHSRTSSWQGFGCLAHTSILTLFAIKHFDKLISTSTCLAKPYWIL